MSELPSFRRFTFRVVLLKVSPIIVRLLSVPDDLSLDEFHEVLQLTFGWRRDPFYTFRILGQQISRRRHLRTRRLSEFQLRRQEKFLYTYDPLSMWEWEIRLVLEGSTFQQPEELDCLCLRPKAVVAEHRVVCDETNVPTVFSSYN